MVIYLLFKWLVHLCRPSRKLHDRRRRRRRCRRRRRRRRRHDRRHPVQTTNLFLIGF